MKTDLLSKARYSIHNSEPQALGRTTVLARGAQLQFEMQTHPDLQQRLLHTEDSCIHIDKAAAETDKICIVLIDHFQQTIPQYCQVGV